MNKKTVATITATILGLLLLWSVTFQLIYSGDSSRPVLQYQCTSSKVFFDVQDEEDSQVVGIDNQSINASIGKRVVVDNREPSESVTFDFGAGREFAYPCR